jgi:hypothetical protein
MIKFKYQRERSNLLGVIHRPVAEVRFKDFEDNPLIAFMYIDSGADITLIPRRFGEAIGLNFEEKDIREISGVGKGSIPVVIREVDLRIGEHEFKARIAWALEESVPPLLGRLDVFDEFDVKFVQREKTIEFEVRGEP